MDYSGNEKISEMMKQHYSSLFDTYGASIQGVDWGGEKSIKRLNIRYQNMLDVIKEDEISPFSILDVGCGYGGNYFYMKESKDYANIAAYTEIDVCENMIAYAANHLDGKFICSDFMNYNFDRTYDYVICNGILTQKLKASIMEMEHYMEELVSKMFALCNKGIAFNVMSNQVNFMVDNLFYKSPSELVVYCSKLTDKFSLNHAYGLYEYTMYLYK